MLQPRQLLIRPLRLLLHSAPHCKLLQLLLVRVVVVLVVLHPHLPARQWPPHPKQLHLLRWVPSLSCRTRRRARLPAALCWARQLNLASSSFAGGCKSLPRETGGRHSWRGMHMATGRYTPASEQLLQLSCSSMRLVGTAVRRRL